MYRVHTCFTCEISYVAPLKFSGSTRNLSGEKTEWCPICGRRVDDSSLPFDSMEDATKYLLFPDKDWSMNGRPL